LKISWESRQAVENETLNFKGGGRLVPLAPDVLRIGVRLNICSVETDLFGTAILPLRTGKIVEITDENNKVVIKAKFQKQKKYTKEETINKLLSVAKFKDSRLRESFAKALGLNFSIEDLQKIAETDDVKFETPNIIAKYEDGIYLKLGDKYYMM